MTNNIHLIKLALKNRTVNNDLTQIIRATEGLEIMNPNDNRKPDLLIFELGKEADKDIAMIQSLLNQDNVGDVCLTSKIAEPGMLMKAMRIGVKEFFTQPIETEAVSNALQQFKTRRNKIDPVTCELMDRWIYSLIKGKNPVEKIPLYLTRRYGDEAIVYE